MGETKRLNSIDIFRLVCAVMVVAIHVHPLADVSSSLAMWTVEILPRIGVPFFFATAGLFYTQKLVQKKQPLRRYLKRLLIPYLIWSTIYLFIEFITWGYGNLKGFVVSCGYQFFLFGSHYHLWFFPALVYAVLITELFHRLGWEKVLFPLGVVLYCIGCLGFAYHELGIKVPFLRYLYGWGQFDLIRRIILYGFPFFISGRMVFSLWKKSQHWNRKLVFAFIIIAALWLAEILVIRQFGVSVSTVQTVFLYPLTIVMVLLLLHYPARKLTGLAHYCRTCAGFIYFSHPLIIMLIEKVTSAFGLTVTETPEFLITNVITILFGCIVFKTGSRIEKLLT